MAEYVLFSMLTTLFNLLGPHLQQNPSSDCIDKLMRLKLILCPDIEAFTSGSRLLCKLYKIQPY